MKNRICYLARQYMEQQGSFHSHSQAWKGHLSIDGLQRRANELTQLSANCGISVQRCGE